MHDIYSFLSGPMVWISLIVCIGGCIWRLVSRALLAREKDSVVYVYMEPKFAARSILHWIVPFASENMRQRPVMTVVTFVFHLGAVLVPIFLLAHVIMWNEAWDIAWWTLPDGVADIMTLAVIFSCVFFLCRRLFLPEVKYLTRASDYLILVAVAAPFVTGFWAYHQWPGHAFMMLLHMATGEIALMMIPFTRLSHMLYFPFTRAYIGSEFGGVRHARDW